MSVGEWFSGRVFRLVHGHNLVYNTCWEDPRLDRVALDLQPDDDVLVITSAGCNALDYALAGPRHVYAVDMNPRQNALLELKLAAICQLDYTDFFAMFGRGRWAHVRDVYRSVLRAELSAWSRNYWDRRIGFFDHPRCSFYFRGTSGVFARAMNMYLDRVCHLRPQVEAILCAETLEEQRRIYREEVRERFWSPAMRFAMKRDATLSMVGVPRAQRRQVDEQYPGGLVKFVEDCLDAVFGELPLADNYFWRVYLTGSYSHECCPEYLKPENFLRLKQGLANSVSVHTDSVQGFLQHHPGTISRFVLLDHMDWLSDKFFPMLELEWQNIVDRAAPRTRVIWRSGGLQTDYLNRVNVHAGGRLRQLPELLSYQRELASHLHAQDRVHTYGSFHIADIAA